MLIQKYVIDLIESIVVKDIKWLVLVYVSKENISWRFIEKLKISKQNKRIQIRYYQKSENYLGFIYLASFYDFLKYTLIMKIIIISFQKIINFFIIFTIKCNKLIVLN